MRKISIFLILLSLLFSTFVFTACNNGGGEELPDFQIVVRETDYVKINENGFVIEADNTVTIPQGEVYDKEGKYCADFKVARVITDAQGNRKAGTLQMKHGEVYNVSYTATNGETELKKEYKLYAYDTTLPSIALLDIQRTYNLGDTVNIKVNSISYDVDYEKSTFILKNETKGTESALSFKDNNTFVAETESESYKIIANLVDLNGNSQKFEYGFVIAGNFKDTEIAKNDIWDFEEIGYINNIKVSGESDDLDYSIVTTGIPENTTSLEVGGGALKLVLKAGERYVLTLTNGNGFVIEDCSTIGFRLWTDKVIDIFELYNVTDNSMSDLSWKAGEREKWQNVEFNPLGAFSSEYFFESVKIVLSCEVDTTVYIDSVYYNDYVDPWRDEDIPEGDLAVFDDDGYLNRITEPLDGDSTTFGGSWEIVTEIPGTTDFTGGALKFMSTTDANIVSDDRSRDGFKYQFFDKLSVDEIGGIVIRVYCEDPHQILVVNFVDQKMGTSTPLWLSIDGVTGRWVNVILSGELLRDKIEGFNNMTHINLRFLRRASDQVAGQENYVSYVDKISLYDLDFDKIKYTFESDYDTFAVESLNYATAVRVQDDKAEDGWAMHAVTGLYQEGSGMIFNFGHLDLSKYSSIYIRIRTVLSAWDNDKVSIYGNEIHLKYGGYSEYTTIDLLPYLLENGQTHLDTLRVSAAYCSGIGIFVDSIQFVKKEDAPKYEDFTLNASDLIQYVGPAGYDNFSGGNIANVVENSATVGAYQGKDSVLTFKTAPHVVSGTAYTYSGGGLYIDLRDLVTSGKIVASQEFTLNITVYVTTDTGFRHGTISGKELNYHSWENKWVTASGNGAWVTYTVSSADIRAVCGNNEITGIYIAHAGSVGSTFAIESVSFDFAEVN